MAVHTYHENSSVIRVLSYRARCVRRDSRETDLREHSDAVAAPRQYVSRTDFVSVHHADGSKTPPL